MTHNPHLIQRLAAVQQALMAQRSGAIGLPSAVAGSERETFVREYLGKVFASNRRSTTGVITDATGALSGQVDVAIEFGHVPSFPMPATEDRLLLAEGVAVVVEVKSNLSAQWGEVEATTKKVRALKRKVAAKMYFGSAPPPTIPVIAVGYTGYATTEGLEKRLQSTPEDSRPDAALSIDSGCFVGFGITATGALGLYGLAVAINRVVSALAFAHPNLLDYVMREDV